MKIREFKDKDIPQISKLYFNTVRKINSKDYSREHVETWAPEIYDDSFWSRRFDNYTVLVAEDADIILGFCELQYPGHIDCFYVHHQWQRKGVGTQLLKSVESIAEKSSFKRLFADVSITARPFFSEMGFETVSVINKKYSELNFKLYFMEMYLTA